MWRILSVFILSLVVILAGCAGAAKPVPSKPVDITEGTRQMLKGTGWYQKGCYHRALDHFFRAHELFTSIDQLDGIARSLNSIGNSYRFLDDWKSALLFYDEAVGVYYEIKDMTGVSQALTNKAATLTVGGRFDEASLVLDAAENIARENGLNLFWIMNNRGVLFTRQKAYENAERVLLEARAISSEEDPVQVATNNYALGNLMITTGRYKAAEGYLTAALEADRRSGYHKGVADDLGALGIVYLKLGQMDRAVAVLKRSAKICALLGFGEKAGNIMEHLAELSRTTGTDLSVTTHFVDRWSEGEMLENPCN